MDSLSYVICTGDIKIVLKLKASCTYENIRKNQHQKLTTSKVRYFKVISQKLIKLIFRISQQKRIVIKRNMKIHSTFSQLVRKIYFLLV